jgi:uncharacterized protein
VKVLAFSDVHEDARQAQRLAEMAEEVDLVLAAGDFGSFHRGVEKVIDMLVVVETPTVLVPGNHETDEALRAACEGWKAATVLHGEGTEIEGMPVYGLGAGVPPTPWDWSFDLSEEEAAAALAGCPEGALLVIHSPPKGHLDGRDLGSEAILRTIEEKRPPLAVCGHIHECQGQEATVGSTRLINAGPEGVLAEV